MDFDIVVVTRNRQSVLPLALRTMLSQARLPKRLIIVDSSDDHALTSQLVGCFQSTAEIKLLQSDPGIQYQRNVGLQHVTSPVVFFPDDDALWYPGFAEAVMRIYERDSRVACVGGEDAECAPSAVLKETLPYKLTLHDRFARLAAPVLRPIETKYLTDPLYPGEHWRSFWPAQPSPSWLTEEDAVLCGPVTGYRMSFRTDIIRKLGGFDEALGRYGMFEDSEATLGSLNVGINVRANRAKVFHYRNPGRRSNGAEWGMMAILNRTYVICKHAESGPARTKLKTFLRYQVLRYLLQARNKYGIERLRGALYGLGKIEHLLNSPRAELASRYLEIRRAFQ